MNAMSEEYTDNVVIFDNQGDGWTIAPCGTDEIDNELRESLEAYGVEA